MKSPQRKRKQLKRAAAFRVVPITIRYLRQNNRALDRQFRFHPWKLAK